MTQNPNLFPIGIFDSGLGGLTVYRRIRELLPYEDIIYLGDTARVPYGSKSKETVKDFAIQITRFLLEQPVKMIVVACNTASSMALEELKSLTDVPVIGVIVPGVKSAEHVSENNKVGVIGTTATISTAAYENEMQKVNPDITMVSRACPLFVSLVEEGWANHPVTVQIAEEYLHPIIQQEVDTLILGCTHYPLLEPALRKILPESVKIVDSALAVANYVNKILIDTKLVKQENQKGRDTFYVTDVPQKFSEISGSFLNRTLDDVKLLPVEILDSYSLVEK